MVRAFIYKSFYLFRFFYILLNSKFFASSLRCSEKQDSCLSFDFSSSILLLFLKYFLLGIPFPGKFRIKQIPIVLSGCLASLRFSREFYLLYRRKSFTIQLSYLAIGLYHLFYFASL